MVSPSKAVLDKLFATAAPLSGVFLSYLRHHRIFREYYALAEQFDFEQTTYRQFGKTPADRVEYLAAVRPVLDSMKAMRERVAGELRLEFVRLQRVGFGVRRPLQEPIHHIPIPPSTWAVLNFSLDNDEAGEETIRFAHVCVAGTGLLSNDERNTLRLALTTVADGHSAAPITGAPPLDEAESLSDVVGVQRVANAIKKTAVTFVEPGKTKEEPRTGDVLTTTGPNIRQSADVAPQRKLAGRPTMKNDIHCLQLARWREGRTATGLAEEARQLAKEMLGRLHRGPAIRIPKPSSIENIIRKRYNVLKRKSKTVNYLMGRTTI